MLDITLQEVRQGKYSPQEYFDYLIEIVEGLSEAKKKGMLLRIIYMDPIREKEILENAWKELLRCKKWQRIFKRLGKQYSIPGIVNHSLKTLKKEQRQKPTLFAVYPSHRFIGQKLPHVILGFPRVLNSAEEEIDIEEWLSHELKHIKDCYFGISIGDYSISQESLDQKEISGKFFHALIEARAYHHIFYKLFLAEKEGKTRKPGDKFLSNEVEGFFKNYSLMAKIASTQLERTIADIQLREFHIIPEKLKLTKEQREMGITKGFTLRIDIEKKPMYWTVFKGNKKINSFHPRLGST